MGVSVDLTGRRVLVTGASSGIGAVTCRSIVACGGSVAMVARRKERLDALHDELGDRAVAVPADVTDLDALEVAVNRAAETLGGLDTVISVAGRSMVGTITTGTPQRWRELIDLNLVAPLATVRYAVEHFPATGRRDVVVVGSTAALLSLPGVGIYSATKRGLQAACEVLRLELAPAAINVSLVMPGMFETEGLTFEGVTFDGDVPDSNFPVLVEGTAPGAPEPLGDTIAFMIGLPDGFCVNELVARPTGHLTP